MKLLDRKVLVKALVGSHNYNLATETSDKDYKVFTAPTFEELYKMKRYSKQIITPTEDLDIHDVRKLNELFFKSNINFLEILASKDLYIANDSPELKQIFGMKKEIFKINLPYFFNACKGMHLNKMSLLRKGTEGTQHLVDKFGYDTKQALHAYRVLRVIVDFAQTEFEDFESSIWYEGEDLEFMLDIKNGVFGLDVFENFIQHYYHAIFLQLEGTYKSFQPNTKLKEELEELVMQLVKREIMS